MVAPAPWRTLGLPSLPSLPSGLPDLSGYNPLNTIPSVPTSLPASIPGGFQDPDGMLAQVARQNGLDPNDPNVQGYINSIQQAAIAEGLPPAAQDVISRVTTYGTQYMDLYKQLSNMGVGDAVNQALLAARKYVTQNHELAGALTTVQGLVSAFNMIGKGGATPQDIVAAFSGPVIGVIAAAVGATGVGAAVVAVIAVAAQLMDALGAFKSGPPAQRVDCGTGGYFDYTGGGNPSFSVGCGVVFDLSNGGPVSPGSVNWRSFPQVNNPDDAWWFQVMPSEGTYTTWKGAKWIPRPDGGGIPIEEFFNGWHHMVANGGDADYVAAWTTPRDFTLYIPNLVRNGQLPQHMSNEQLLALISFDAAHVKAWEANCEYWLNGLKAAADANGQPDDTKVLTHLAEIWNRSHEPGQTLAIGVPPSAGWYIGWVGTIAALQNQQVKGNSEIMTPDGKSLLIHTGPAKNALGVKPGGTRVNIPVTSKAVVTAVAAGGVTLAAGAFVYSRMTGMTFGKAGDQLWKSTVGKFWHWLMR